MKDKQEKRKRRHQRVRAKIFGTKERPRLYVFCSNKHIYAQLIDDQVGKVLIAVKDMEIKTKKSDSGKTGLAFKVGELVAKKAIEQEIKKVVFDRGGSLYHGKVKALAEGARQGGLIF